MDLSVDDLANWTALIGLVERFITVAVYEEDPTAQGGAGPFGKYPYLGSLKYVPPLVVKGSQLFGPRFVGSAHRYRPNPEAVEGAMLYDVVHVRIDIETETVGVDLKFQSATPPGPEPVFPHVSYKTTWSSSPTSVALDGQFSDYEFLVLMGEGQLDFSRHGRFLQPA